MDEVLGNASCPVSLNQTANATVCFRTSYSRYPNSSRMTLSPTATAVHNLTLVVTEGYNYLTLRNQDTFVASPRDVVGLTVNQTAEYLSSSLPVTNQTSNSSLLTNSPNEISNGSFINSNYALNCTDRRFRVLRELSLYGFLPFETRILLRLMDPGNVPLGINVRDSTRLVTNLQKIVIVQRPVEGMQVFFKHIVRFNSTQTLGFRVQRGTNASCVWSLKGRNVSIGGVVDGTAGGKIHRNESERVGKYPEGVENYFNYKHDVYGEFKYSVTCSNKISNISESVPISVRRNISDFNASFCFASFAYGHARTCWKAVAAGDHVRFTWIIGDDVITASKFKFIFSNHTSPGHQELINVSATNFVSKETLTVWFKILENPLSVHISPSLIVPSLSAVSFSGVLTWKGYPNGTAFYKSYGVNISKELRRFIDIPAFRVKVDGIVRASNVSTGTPLNYTFPLAGSNRVIHKVYFEGVGHPELNREEQITVVDRIQRLRITTSCSKEVVVVSQRCVFSASFDQGSNVICSWQVVSRNFTPECRIAFEFRELGHFKVHVTAKNQVSLAIAHFNVTIIPLTKYRTTSSKVPLFTETLNTLSHHVRSSYDALTSSIISADSGSLISYVTSSSGPTSKLRSSNEETTSFMPRRPATITVPFLSNVVPVSSITTSTMVLPVTKTSNNPVSGIKISTMATETSEKASHDVMSPSDIPTSNMIPAKSGSLMSHMTSSSGRTSKLTSSNVEPTRFMSQSRATTFLLPSSVASVNSVIAKQLLGSLAIYGPRFAKVGKEITYSASVAGADVVFSWFINNTLQATQNSSISLIFHQAGLFPISVKASSRIDRKQATRFVFAQLPISGLQIKSYQKYFNRSVAVVFTLGTGTNVSFLANFGDGSPHISGSVRKLSENVSVIHQYENPGRYNISISVSNMVGPNVTTGVQVIVKETCIVESVVLHGASPTPRLSRKFSEVDEIVMSVTTNMKCSSSSRLKFRWRILRINDSISENFPIKLENITTDQSVLRFPASQITVGMYKVLVTVIASLDGTSTDYMRFFRRIQLNLVVMLSCGSARTTSVDKPLTLNATVVDGMKEGRSLAYEWFCDEKRDRSCFREVISRNSSVVRFPGNFLQFGESYNFVVIVTDGNRQGMASQRVSVSRSNTTLQVCLR